VKHELEHHAFSVARKLLKGMVVPLLGAGANACGRPPDFAWRPRDARHLPTGGELAAYLAEVFRTPAELATSGDLLRVSEYIDAVERDAAEMYEELHEIFDADYPPGPAHRFLAGLAPILRRRGVPLQVILTTNYDDALERAFDAIGEPYDLLTYVSSSPKEQRGGFMHTPPGEEPRPVPIGSANDYTGLSLRERSVLLKLHGAVHRLGSFKEDNYVITEDHYIDYLAASDITQRLPALVN
jgi:hypothetical protein